MEKKFYDQLEDKETFFYKRSGSLSKNIEKKTYYVRIPVVNPRSNKLFSSFPIQFCFYFKSYLPQDFWYSRKAEIIFHDFIH